MTKEQLKIAAFEFAIKTIGASNILYSTETSAMLRNEAELIYQWLLKP